MIKFRAKYLSFQTSNGQTFYDIPVAGVRKSHARLILIDLKGEAFGELITPNLAWWWVYEEAADGRNR